MTICSSLHSFAFKQRNVQRKIKKVREREGERGGGEREGGREKGREGKRERGGEKMRDRGRENGSNFCIALSFRNYRGMTISQANLRAVVRCSFDLVAGR